MFKFVLLRLLTIIPILLGVTFITFTIISFTPGTPGRTILGPTATLEEVDALNEMLGHNRPFFARFFDYVKNAVTRMDFGKSYRSQKPVFDEIGVRFPYTLRLAALGMFFVGVIGIPLGVLAAVRQHSIYDMMSTVMAMVITAIPSFWLGMLLLLFFSSRLGWLPSNGAESWESYIMPLMMIALPGAAGLMRMMRSTMLETIRLDYIRTARAKGASEKRVIFRHALKNAILPVINMLALNFGGMLGGTIVCETIFGIPGLGLLIVNSIKMKDVPMVLASTIFLAAIFCVIIVVIDVIYSFIDPRIKARFVK